MKMKNPFNPIINAYYKLSNWGKVLIFVVILLALVIFFKTINEKNRKEGFEQNNEFLFHCL